MNMLKEGRARQVDPCPWRTPGVIRICLVSRDLPRHKSSITNTLLHMIIDRNSLTPEAPHHQRAKEPTVLCQE